MPNVKLPSLKPLVSLCKRRGFIYPGSEIYGGFANTYSYGPYGVELKKNIKDLWWKVFVQERRDIVGLDGPILLHPKTWEASGHIGSFNDRRIDCKNCKARLRVDHLIEKALGLKVEGLSLKDLTSLIDQNDIKCPKCGLHDFTEARDFNLMFSTQMSKTREKEEDITYLRPETAQAIFLEFKNIIDSMRVKLPFGIAQIGKAFRNEITPGNFLFRTIEFEQMEIEYFIREETWQKHFDSWLEEMNKWCERIGLKKENLATFEHSPEQLSHYSKKTMDIIYDFPFGKQELYGLAYRTDFDLKKHQEVSQVSQTYADLEKKENFIPHIIEPTFGVDRTVLALLCDAYDEEKLENNEIRTVLHLSSLMAPVKVAVFPLMRKEHLSKKAKEIFDMAKSNWSAEYDETGAIGRRYRRQDELGTPFCITVDYETLENNTVTLRDRDTMEQQRVEAKKIIPTLRDLIR